MSNKRTCTICDKTYDYCQRCEKYASLPRWYSRFCSETCKTIYDATTRFEYGHIGKEDANKVLSSIDTSIVVNDSIKAIIDKLNYIEEPIEEITSDEEKPKKIYKKRIKSEEDIVNED